MLCECGCGRNIEDSPTYKARMSRKRKGRKIKYYSKQCRSRVSEVKKHFKYKSDTRTKLCECGCGGLIRRNSDGKWACYLPHHYQKTDNGRLRSKENGLRNREVIRERFGKIWSNKERSDRRSKLASESMIAKWSDLQWRESVISKMKSARASKYSEVRYCKCGCGGMIELKGREYIPGHYQELFKKQLLEQRGYPPLCACGCGNPVKWNKHDHKWGKYLRGHCNKHQAYRDNMSIVMNALEKKLELSEKSRLNYLNPAYIENHKKAMNRRPNGFEFLFECLSPDGLRYVGDGSLWITLPGNRPKNPDFIFGDDKVIELHGDYWHKGENEVELIAAYKGVGYDCLVIWESEMKNREEVLDKVSKFLGKDIWQMKLPMR